ncbi:MAG: hypothetical protein A2784_00585 [Candidatus Chisholmbacteria bacterium RIFCSPHIGHO2_01_FULL_48_12]|uniref:Type I restriction modification DNA specificity domain-containing protein n=2 Tax=Patescibacteria group TaxID=1783273 RepID=A0A1G1VQB4_9BACT|nr:MAG: hypothetical protein A2784_00585 [Candidatus Chisholmbacteria bacterium RIFCSPHIGHO2_01_FULL_48_12]OGZ39614.1 MAG: hypothetical protein A3I20_03585 [Candidatus Portnoybacteria bacterium RIFCSPLOWO2_02_FULL_40_15]
MNTSTQKLFDQDRAGETPDTWKFVLASDYCKRVTDGTHDSPKQQSDGNYLVTSRHITGGGIDLSKAYNISKSDFQEINRRSGVDQWDILFSMIGTVGEAVLVKNPKVDFAIKNIGLFKNKSEIEAKWLYYYLKSPLAVHYIKSHSSGSTQQYLTLDSLRKFPVLVVSKEEESKILSILSSLDDKIELNRKMNKTLEEIGKALFKRWFVDFEFPFDFAQGKPNFDGKPLPAEVLTKAGYKSSGGKMVDSELGEIPKDWTVLPIEDVVTIKGGTTPSTSNPDYWTNGKINWATPKDLSVLQSSILLDTERQITEKGLERIGSGLLPMNSILLSSRAPIGYLAITNIPVAVNQGFIGIVCNKGISSYYLYFWLKFNMNLIKNMANGSTFLEISKSSFKQILFVKPSAQVLKRFEQVTASFFSNIVKNELELNTLTKIRDSLLPRLMSGKLRV